MGPPPLSRPYWTPSGGAFNRSRRHRKHPAPMALLHCTGSHTFQGGQGSREPDPLPRLRPRN